MRIILSKDRPAQLDLLLRSLERNAPPERTKVLYRASTARFITGYKSVNKGRWYLEDENYASGGFEDSIRYFLRLADATAQQYISFFCDDDICYRVGWQLPKTLEHDVLCFSLRMGDNTKIQYPSNMPQRVPLLPKWRWFDADLDFAYPGSIDGHVFRTVDVMGMLQYASFPNPTALECALVEGCNQLADRRPLMQCFSSSVVVGNPVNRVSEQSNVRFGASFPASAEWCNDRFLGGERIALERLDFSGVNGAHTEIKFEWEKRP